MSIVANMVNPFPISSDCFSKNSYMNAVLTVPAGTRQLYMNTDGWKQFSHIIEEGTESYAVYDDGTLTFYYDVQKDMRNGETYGLEKMGVVLFQQWYDRAGSVTKVVFDKSFAEARPTATDRWFWGFTSLLEIEGIENLNTSDVTNMCGMFSNCSLTGLDLRHLNTDQATNMANMFEGCSSLKVLVLGHSFVSSQTFDTRGMFSDCNDVVFCVPVGTKVFYESVGDWNASNLIVEMYDPNGDGILNESDVNEFVSCIMGRPSYYFNKVVADLNADGEVNVADLVVFMNMLTRLRQLNL